MMKKGISITVFLLISALCLLAQSKKYDTQEKDDFLEGDSYFVYGDFLTAYTYFKKIEEVDLEFEELYFKMGYSLMYLKRYAEAIPYLTKSKDYQIESEYYLAKINLHLELLDQAKKHISNYENKWTEQSAKYTKNDIDFIKEQIAFAEEALSMPEQVNILNLGPAINTSADEYVPLIDANESQLIFTSKRLSAKNGMSPSGFPFEDVFVSKKLENGDWSAAVELPGNVNSPLNDACVGLSPNGEILYVFRPNESIYAGDLYESEFKNNQWNTPVILSNRINDFRSVEASASVAIDESVLYFSSNREGGYGGFDIYRSIKLPNGEWSWPKNLGPRINTAKNEDAPFLHPNGKTLYFSSQGHKNMGGYDVFKSEKSDDDTWTIPSNLGSPTNTTRDDIHFVISANEQRAYYSSKKESGYGGQDIYLIDYLEKSLRQSVIRGNIFDSNKQAVRADISLIEVETGELSGVYVSNNKSGGFIFLVNPNVEYELIVEALGFEESVQILNYTVEDLKKPQEIKINLINSGSE